MGALASLLKRALGSNKQLRTLMIGLDSAGKTTILYRLKLGEVIPTVATVGFNVETVKYKNISFTVWDVGGQDKIRPLWRHYFHGANSLIFVVDSNDPDRFDEARYELHRLVGQRELRDVVMLVLANKQDLPNAVPPSVITTKLDLHSLTSQDWFVQGTCAATGDGLYEAFEWLSQQIKNIK